MQLAHTTVNPNENTNASYPGMMGMGNMETGEMGILGMTFFWIFWILLIVIMIGVARWIWTKK